jgi:hypothetical protein
MSNGPAGMLDRLLGERQAPAKARRARTAPAAAVPGRPRVAPRRNQVRVVVVVVSVEANLLERLRRAIYWSPGVTMAGLTEAGLERELDRLEQKHGSFKAIPSGQRVKRGRPTRGRTSSGDSRRGATRRRPSRRSTNSM